MAKKITKSAPKVSQETIGDGARTPQLLSADGSAIARKLVWPFAEGSVENWEWADMYKIGRGSARKRVSRRQFVAPHHYYNYMSAKSAALAEAYSAVAQDAEKNPSAYGRPSSADKFAELRLAGAKRVADKFGCTLEEALALLEV